MDSERANVDLGICECGCNFVYSFESVGNE